MARSSFSTPARACACWGSQLVAEFDTQPLDLTLLLTHTHWDHIQGLPFFLPVYKPQNHLRILGYEGARHGLEVVLAGQMESPFFPIGLREVPANVRIEELKEMSFNVGPVRVQAAFANHPGICVGYRLFTSDGSIAFFPDNEPFPEGASAASRGGADEPARAFARSENRKLIDFLRGTDVLIMDTQYDAEEYKRHTGWGHGCLDDVVALALEAEVKTLFLFHHDPNHDDAKISQMLAHARQARRRPQGQAPGRGRPRRGDGGTAGGAKLGNAARASPPGSRDCSKPSMQLPTAFPITPALAPRERAELWSALGDAPPVPISGRKSPLSPRRGLGRGGTGRPTAQMRAKPRIPPLPAGDPRVLRDLTIRQSSVEVLTLLR